MELLLLTCKHCADKRSTKWESTQDHHSFHQMNSKKQPLIISQHCVKPMSEIVWHTKSQSQYIISFYLIVNWCEQVCKVQKDMQGC